MLGPSNNLSPVELVGLLFPGIRKRPHFIVSQSTEYEEKAGENAGFGGHADVDCCGDAAGRKETISDVLVLRERRDIVAK